MQGSWGALGHFGGALGKIFEGLRGMLAGLEENVDGLGRILHTRVIKTAILVLPNISSWLLHASCNLPGTWTAGLSTFVRTLFPMRIFEMNSLGR